VAIVDAGQAAQVVRLQADAATGGLTINLFWIIVAALNFLVFFAVLYLIVLKPIGVTLRERRARIEQGIHDADQARIERAAGEAAAVTELNAARRAPRTWQRHERSWRGCVNARRPISRRRRSGRSPLSGRTSPPSPSMPPAGSCARR
jgi:hypothetical protein